VRGTINQLPPESPEERAARHAAVAERRARTPIMVHRGARSVAPENTLAAYAGAMDLGADGVEIDIRRSKDGVLYLFHDDTLERMTNGSGRVRDLTYYQLLTLTPKGGGDDPARRPTTLLAFLALARTRAMLIHLDVKESGCQVEIARLFEKADMWDHLVEVNAGNAELIRHNRKVELLPYKGWWPKGDRASDPALYKPLLDRGGVMVFTEDPRAAVKVLGRTPPGPRPVPPELFALWGPDGIIKP
jgi:hypothetical protein